MESFEQGTLDRSMDPITFLLVDTVRESVERDEYMALILHTWMTATKHESVMRALRRDALDVLFVRVWEVYTYGEDMNAGDGLDVILQPLLQFYPTEFFEYRQEIRAIIAKHFTEDFINEVFAQWAKHWVALQARVDKARAASAAQLAEQWVELEARLDEAAAAGA